jgi:hypothetical protein
VPTEQRRWGDEESSPAFPGEHPAEGSQEAAVDGSVLDPAVDLALKDAHLVTEDHEFDVLVSLAPAARDYERQNPAQPEVQEGEGHAP